MSLAAVTEDEQADGESAWEIVAEIIAEVLPPGEYVAVEVAEKVLRVMAERHPERLAEFYEDIAVRHIAATIRESGRARQVHERRETQRHRTAEQIDEAVQSGSLSPFTSTLAVGNRQFKPVGKMTGEDHMYVATQQKARGRTSLLLGKFHEQVAKRVKDKTTEDVMDEATYLRLRQSIVGPSSHSEPPD